MLSRYATRNTVILLVSLVVMMLERSPEFGLGAGTFYHTHNDYAQFAAESGLLGIGLIGGFVVLTLLAALRAQWVRRDPLMRGMSFASIMGIAAILIHSTADFNLQIPANATYFMVLLALGWISLGHRSQLPPSGEGAGHQSQLPLPSGVRAG